MESSASTRRDFVTAVARWSALAGLAGMSAGLLTRARPLNRDGTCGIAPACGGCPAWTTCRLPERIPRVTVHGDCPNFRGGDDAALDNELCRRENGTVPLGRKGTGTFFGLVRPRSTRIETAEK